jgi:hypothetical protein
MTAPLRTELPFGFLVIESVVFLPATTQGFLSANNKEDKSIGLEDSQRSPLQPSQKANTANLSDAANVTANRKQGFFSGSGVQEWKLGMESQEEDHIALLPQPTQEREGPYG